MSLPQDLIGLPTQCGYVSVLLWSLTLPKGGLPWTENNLQLQHQRATSSCHVSVLSIAVT